MREFISGGTSATESLAASLRRSMNSSDSSVTSLRRTSGSGLLTLTFSMAMYSVRNF